MNAMTLGTLLVQPVQGFICWFVGVQGPVFSDPATGVTHLKEEQRFYWCILGTFMLKCLGIRHSSLTRLRILLYV